MAVVSGTANLIAIFMAYSKAAPYTVRMSNQSSAIFTMLALGCSVVAGPAMARHPEQDAAYSEMRSGNIRPFGEIRDRVMPRMGGASYLGSEFDSRSATYRLKFMRSGSVIWVDVDAKTGAIIGRSGD